MEREKVNITFLENRKKELQETIDFNNKIINSNKNSISNMTSLGIIDEELVKQFEENNKELEDMNKDLYNKIKETENLLQEEIN